MSSEAAEMCAKILDMGDDRHALGHFLNRLHAKERGLGQAVGKDELAKTLQRAANRDVSTDADFAGGSSSSLQEIVARQIHERYVSVPRPSPLPTAFVPERQNEPIRVTNSDRYGNRYWIDTRDGSLAIELATAREPRYRFHAYYVPWLLSPGQRFRYGDSLWTCNDDGSVHYELVEPEQLDPVLLTASPKVVEASPTVRGRRRIIIRDDP